MWYIPSAFQRYETPKVEDKSEEMITRDKIRKKLKDSGIRKLLEYASSMRGMSAQIDYLRLDERCRYSPE